jgi:hypothetical protein
VETTEEQGFLRPPKAAPHRALEWLDVVIHIHLRFSFPFTQETSPWGSKDIAGRGNDLIGGPSVED